MIQYRDWVEVTEDGKRYVCEGYYLFGIIPLMINKYDTSIPDNDE